jgi:hypothetical protein
MSTDTKPRSASLAIRGNQYVYAASLTGFLLHFGEKLYPRDEEARKVFEARVLELTTIEPIAERVNALEQFISNHKGA